MTEQPSYLIMAKAMEAQVLRPRFTPFDVTVRLFLELVAGRRLLRRLRGDYKPLCSRVMPKLKDDRHLAECVIRRNFESLLADPVLDPTRPALTSFAFPDWIASVLPDGMSDADFAAFVKSCVGFIDNYQQRFEREQTLLRGTQIVASFGALLFYGVMLTAFTLDLMHGGPFGMVILMVAVAKCLGSLVSLEPWP